MFNMAFIYLLFDRSLDSGDYGEAMTLGALKEFHRRRVQVLTEAGPDLLAFETIPNKLEAQVMITSLFITFNIFNFLFVEEF